MKKTAYVVLNDVYHHTETYLPCVNQIFAKDIFDVHITESIRDVVLLPKKPDMVLNFTIGRPDGELPLSMDEQQLLKYCVEQGMGMLYVHAGVAVIEENTPTFDMAKGHFVSHPPEYSMVYCAPINGVVHPVLEGITPFEAMDEHYFCKVDFTNTQPILATRSKDGTEIGGFAHQIGVGRVVTLAQGHTTEMLEKMQPILINAINWICNQS